MQKTARVLRVKLEEKEESVAKKVNKNEKSMRLALQIERSGSSCTKKRQHASLPMVLDRREPSGYNQEGAEA